MPSCGEKVITPHCKTQFHGGHSFPACWWGFTVLPCADEPLGQTFCRSVLLPSQRAEPTSRRSGWKWKTHAFQPPLQLGWPSSRPGRHQRRAAGRKSPVKQGMRELGPLYSSGHEWVKVWCLELWEPCGDQEENYLWKKAEDSWSEREQGPKFLMSSWFPWNTQSWNDLLLDFFQWERLNACIINSDCPELNRACVLSWTWFCDPTDCSALPSVEFSKQEYWGGLPFPTAGDLLNPEIEPESSVFCMGRQILYYCTTWEAPDFPKHPIYLIKFSVTCKVS